MLVMFLFHSSSLLVFFLLKIVQIDIVGHSSHYNFAKSLLYFAYNFELLPINIIWNNLALNCFFHA